VLFSSTRGDVMSNLIFEDGEKYAIIALSNVKVDESLPQEVQLSSEFWVTRSLPVNLDSHWRQWIGSIQADKLEKARLLLISKGPSKAPEVLDDENQKYQCGTNDLYWGLLVTDFLKVYGTLLTGAKLPSGLNVRSIGTMDTPEVIPGTRVAPIDLQRLEKAAAFAKSARLLSERKEHARFWKIIHGFYAGIMSHSAEDRLHQFTRCVEGFIYPDIGQTKRQFKSRTELFIGPQHHDLTGTLYDARSAVEHLHDPLKDISGSTKREKVVALFQKAFEAEVLARYCIARLLGNDALWSYFEDDSALENFWTLRQRDRQKLWGEKLQMKQVLSSFDTSLIRDENLGSL
jgi:hypothetical protein